MGYSDRLKVVMDWSCKGGCIVDAKLYCRSRFITGNEFF